MNDPGALRYLEKITATLRNATSSRNRALRDAAFASGRLIGAGRLDRDAVESRLLEIADEIGSMTHEKRSRSVSTIRRSITKGEEAPLHLRDGGTVPTVSCTPSHAPRCPSLRPPPLRPPLREIRALWEMSTRLTGDSEAVAWCTSRSLDAALLEDWDTARVVPAGWRLMRWARWQGMNWNESGHRLLVRLFDADLRFVSLRARRIREGLGPKDLTPAGYEVRGCIMADGMALRVLSGDVPAWWAPEFAVQEGTPDFLTRVSLQTDACEDGPAVLGVFEGSWTPELADRFPGGAAIHVRDHADSTGQSHVQRINRSLGDRCRVFQISRDPRANSHGQQAI